MGKLKISAGTLARTIILALALLNQGLSMFGYSILPIEDTQIESLVSGIWVICASIATWWKNSSMTQAAIVGDKVTKAIKSGEISSFEVESIINTNK